MHGESDPLASEEAALSVLRIMGHGTRSSANGAEQQTWRADPAGSHPGPVATYSLMFDARFAEALAAARSSTPATEYGAAVAAQVEALCTGAVPGGIVRPQGDLSTVAGAMAVFHAAEAAHVVGDLESCASMTSEALAAGISNPDARLWVRLCLVRALLFKGEVAKAAAELSLASADVSTPLAKVSVRCLEAMIVGFKGDDSAVIAVAEDLRSSMDLPRAYSDAGIALLGAMGLALCHLPNAAAELLTHGAGGAGLPLLPPALRTYGYDLLVEAAVAAGNGALAAWIMVDFDRIDLAANRQFIAAREATRARLAAAPGWRPSTGTGSPLVDARALLAAAKFGQAHNLEAEALMEAGSTEELRAWMSRALAAVGSVPRPLPEIGWDRLTPAQQTVARLAARGLSNDEIAKLLVVSRRTVEGHMAAVLATLGLPSRIDLVRSSEPGRELARGPVQGLTPRQNEVAAAMAQGLGNQEIASRLGVSIKAVEKHVHAVFKALGVSSRSAAVARLLDVD